MKVLITGIRGFAGSHLAEYCADRGNIEVFGLGLPKNRPNYLRAATDNVNIIEVDVTDYSAVKRNLKE